MREDVIDKNSLIQNKRTSNMYHFTDYRVRHTLEFEAYYSVDCSVLNMEVARGMLEDVAKQSYSIIDILCDSGNEEYLSNCLLY